MDRREICRQAAELHVANIDQGFLATLGTGFVSLLYESLDSSREHVLMVEERDGRVAGFVAGGNGMGAIYRRMLRHPFRLAASLLPSILKPSRIRRILEILKYGRNSDQRHPKAELLSIAVDPAFRGRGVAEILYCRLVEHFRDGCVDAFKITVGEDLLAAHRFYQRMGAVAASRIQVHHGETSIVYVHRLS